MTKAGHCSRRHSNLTRKWLIESQVNDFASYIAWKCLSTLQQQFCPDGFIRSVLAMAVAVAKGVAMGIIHNTTCWRCAQAVAANSHTRPTSLGTSHKKLCYLLWTNLALLSRLLIQHTKLILLVYKLCWFFRRLWFPIPRTDSWPSGPGTSWERSYF